MLRSRLRNIFLKEKSLEPKKAYNEQHNICVARLKKLRKNTFKVLTYQNYWQQEVLENCNPSLSTK